MSDVPRTEAGRRLLDELAGEGYDPFEVDRDATLAGILAIETEAVRDDEPVRLRELAAEIAKDWNGRPDPSAIRAALEEAITWPSSGTLQMAQAGWRKTATMYDRALAALPDEPVGGPG